LLQDLARLCLALESRNGSEPEPVFELDPVAAGLGCAALFRHRI